jgi:hypothetical protein
MLVKCWVWDTGLRGGTLHARKQLGSVESSGMYSHVEVDRRFNVTTQCCILLHPRRLYTSYSPPWEPEISQTISEISGSRGGDYEDDIDFWAGPSSGGGGNFPQASAMQGPRTDLVLILLTLTVQCACRTWSWSHFNQNIPFKIRTPVVSSYIITWQNGVRREKSWKRSCEVKAVLLLPPIVYDPF